MWKFSKIKPAILLASLLLASCDGGGPFYSVGGYVTGLTGTLVLQNNAGDDLKITAPGKFSFPATFLEGSVYNISVRSQSLWQFCSVSKGSGKVTANVNDVEVSCKAALAQVSTVAGSGASGYADGSASTATFTYPFGITVDKNGYLLISEGAGNHVRKISPAGNVSTFVGSGAPASQDGRGRAASIFRPLGLAQDAQGNAYVAEFGGNLIRKITAAGDVSTVAGNGSQSSFDGHGSLASFNRPHSVALDGAGNLYVAQEDALIRKITSAGQVSTLARLPKAASVVQPLGIAADAAGNIYVADSNHHLIRKITADGSVTTFAGSGNAGAADGVGSSASFHTPMGLALDSDGNLYVADTENDLLRKITPAGQVSTLAGQAGIAGTQNGTGSIARFDAPLGIAVAADGSLYVTDYANHLIRKVTPVPAP